MDRKISIFLLLLACTLSPPLVYSGKYLEFEDIVVTAQKREEASQAVPIAMSTFRGFELEFLSLKNLYELPQYIPGVELFDDRGSGQPTWVIRGVTLTDFNSNNTPTAAIYYDEFYLTSNVLGGIGLFDIEQIEVLKGPQGGLYGRNTSGGAIRVLSTPPALNTFSGYAKVHYGRWDRYGLESAFGGPLNETMGFRVAAMTDQGGGWQDSLATPEDDDHGDRGFYALRGQLLVVPNDEMEILLKIEGGEDQSETALGLARAAIDPTTGGFCADAVAGQADTSNCVTWANFTNLAALSPTGDSGPLVSAQDGDGSRVLTSPINELDNSWINTTARLDWHLPIVTVTSITGYLNFENNQTYDFDGSPLRLFDEDSHADIKGWSQELRLSSIKDRALLTWSFGFSYAEDEIDEDRLGDLTDNVLLFEPSLFGTPLFARREFNQETRSWAVFGQAECQLDEHLALNGSVRYTDEQKDLNDYTFTLPLRGFSDVDKSYELDSNLTGHLGVNLTFFENTLMYGKVTRGFKSGGFFGGLALNPEELNPYREETIWSYEIGVKSVLPISSIQLNGALFYYDYEDLQGFIQVDSQETGTTLTKLGNIGDAEHLGVELQLRWLTPFIEGLTLEAGAGWLDTEIVDSDKISLDPAGVEVPFKGLDRQFAPEWSVSVLARYEYQISDTLLVVVQSDYSWRDDFIIRDSVGTDLDFAVSEHEGYGILNGRLQIGDSNKKWTLALIGKNLTDEEYQISTTQDDLQSFTEIPGIPRNWGIEITYNW